MRTFVIAIVVVTAAHASAQTSDVAAARAVFEANIDAIREQNRPKYLSYYLHSERLVRGGPTGFSTGYDDFAKGAGPWPNSIEASDTVRGCTKVRVVGCAPLIGEAIRRIANEESVSKLFD